MQVMSKIHRDFTTFSRPSTFAFKVRRSIYDIGYKAHISLCHSSIGLFSDDYCESPCIVRPCIGSGHWSSSLSTDGRCPAQAAPTAHGAAPPGVSACHDHQDWSLSGDLGSRNLCSTSWQPWPQSLHGPVWHPGNRLAWGALSDWGAWVPGAWTSHKLDWRDTGLVSSDPACDQLPDRLSPLCQMSMKGFHLKSIPKHGPPPAKLNNVRVINVINVALSSLQAPPYLGYQIICGMINLLKETFGRGIVRAAMMPTESATKAESAPIVFKTGPIVCPAWLMWLILFSL